MERSGSHRWLRLVAVIVVGVPLLLYLLLPLISRLPLVRERIEALIASRVDGDVHIASASLGYDLTVRIHELSASGPELDPFLEVAAIVVRPLADGLFGGPFADVELVTPRLHLDRLPPQPKGEEQAEPFEIPSFSIPVRRVQLSDGYLHWRRGEDAPFLGPLSLSFRAESAGRDLRFALEVDPTLPAMDVSARLDAAHPTVLEELQLSWRDVPVAGVAARYLGTAPESVSGTLQLSAQASGPLDDLSGEGSLLISNLGYQEELRQIAGLKVDADLKGGWSVGKEPVITLTAAIPAGEALWDRFYIDLAAHPLKIRSQLQPAKGGARFDGLDASARGLATIAGSGVLRRDGALERAKGRLTIADLSAIYQLGLRDPYSDIHAFLTETEVHGVLEAQAELRRRDDGFALTGLLKLDGVDIASKRPAFEVEDLSLTLPLQLGPVAADARAETGRVRARHLRAGEVETGEITALLTVSPNAIALSQPMLVPVLSGVVIVSELEARELASEQRRAAFGLSLGDLDLQQITRAMEWPPMVGTLSGSIERISFAGDRMQSDGEIRAHVFDGTVTVRNLRADQLFSSVPTFGMDIEIDDLSLREATRALEVGRVSGVVDGAVTGLEIASSQPTRFQAWMESVSKPGVKQRISVRAIRQISIIGGSGSDPFSRGVLSFFDEYRYAKMGFRCRLERDEFRLRGVETIDGDEYLVVGSTLPPRVNVVTHSQVISFSDMMRRLRRVDAEPEPSANQEQGGEP